MKQTEISESAEAYLKQVKTKKEFQEILVKIKKNFSFEFILKMKEEGIMWTKNLSTKIIMIKLKTSNFQKPNI